MADRLLDAAVDGNLSEVENLLGGARFDSEALLHAFIGAISQGHDQVMHQISGQSEFKASLFNNAALKWALAKKNDKAVDLITSDQTFSFGTHLGVLMAAVRANNPKAAKLCLNCPTLNYTKEFLAECLRKAMKMDHLDVMAPIFEDHRYGIKDSDLRMFTNEDLPAEYKNKFFSAMLNNPSYNPDGDDLIEIGFHDGATNEMRRMAYLHAPENDERCIAHKLTQKEDFTLFKLNCGSEGFDALGAAIKANKYEWVRYMKEHNKIPQEAFNDFDPNEDNELTKILRPELAK